jgi:hypothetical protein
VSQLGLGLDGVVVVSSAAPGRARGRRPEVEGGTQLSLLDPARRAEARTLPAPPGAARPTAAPAVSTPRADAPLFAPRGPASPTARSTTPSSNATPRTSALGPTPGPTPLAASEARPSPGARLLSEARPAPGLTSEGRPTPGLTGEARPTPGPTVPARPARPARASAAPALGPAPSTPARARRRPAIAAEIRLEAELGQRLPVPVLVRVTDNTSTMISFRRRGRALYVRAHRMFGEAPPPVLDALALFVSKDEIPKDTAKLLDEWIDRHRDVLNEARSDALRIQPFGEAHDLQAMFDRLNTQHFGGKIQATITWTRAAKGQRRTSIHMGTYSDELKLIRIHPALDQAWVPEHFVEFVVFHEMLHQVHGVAGHGEARRAVHTPAFRADEKRFPRYAEARRWEKDNLRRLLRY